MKAATLLGGLALAVLVSPMATGAFAAVNPHATTAESNIVLVAAKGQHTCGTMMYWSTKEGKCLDSRMKSAKAKEGEGPAFESECMKGHFGC